MKNVRNALPFAAALVATIACSVDSAPVGLRATPAGNGPKVVFDLKHRPLPAIPLPNDVATIADPSSRTGRRINASLVTPTEMEQKAREGFDAMEGWGTFAPIAVELERAPGADPRAPAIDLEDVRARMQKDGHDFTNDPVYVINLRTGVPVMLDMGDGNFPLTVRDPFKYWPNDPKAKEPNLLFETQEEGAGLTQADYRPELDLDFDGVLDHPNTLGVAASGLDKIDNLVTFYERETDTLILRPLLPMDEKTEYAVVLTDRLRGGTTKEPVRSPFPFVHHPMQTTSVARAKEILGEAAHKNYYGDLAGTGLDHVAFAWTFTTQPVQEDMRLLRDGLYGKGPFGHFADAYPPKVTLARAVGKAAADGEDPPGWEGDPACASKSKKKFTVFLTDPDVRAAYHDFFETVLGFSKGETKRLDDAVSNIDHIVIGTYQSPFLMGDPASLDEDTRFHVNFKTGEGDVQPDTVHFWMIVPKVKPGMKQPFPATYYGHGATGNDTTAMLVAGDFARQGIATIGIDMPEHGLAYGSGDRAIAAAALSTRCLRPWVDAIASGRAHDVDGDGLGDSGGFWWTAHLLHTRDNLRQGLLDSMQATRILRSFDGIRKSEQDFNGDGQPDIAGDFDGDGTPDLGGTAPLYASGVSLGGIMSELQGGADPHVLATAPVSGGGNLVDVGFRSYGVNEAVVEQILSPLVVAIPASDRPPQKDVARTRCGADARSVRFVVNQGNGSKELEVACLRPDELAENMTVVLTNVKNKERRCARTGPDGRFRVPIPATVGDRLDIQLYTKADVVRSYKGCDVVDGAPIGRRIQTWEQAATMGSPVANEAFTCRSDAGCQQFRDTFYEVGSDLVAPQEGLGLMRQTPEVRRLRDLAQAIVDVADPVNFAPYYMLRPLIDENGARSPAHALLAITTVGDNFVPVASGLTFARAAGALPFLSPDVITRMPEYADYATPPALYEALGGKTPNDVLIENGVVEGIARLQRTHAGPACNVNYVPGDICTKDPKPDPATCASALFDADWLSEGAERFDQPHPATPLRLARIADARVSDLGSLASAWRPRTASTPQGPDETAWTADATVVANMLQYVVPEGQHGWSAGDACKAWDDATYARTVA